MVDKTMILEQLLQLPNPVGNTGILHDFSGNLEQYGIGVEDLTDLVEIATSQQLYHGTNDEFFAMQYALYALGALQHTEACPVLLQQLERIAVDEDEWVDSYVFVFEMMGEKAIPYLLDACKSISLELIFILTESLAKLVNKFPAFRQQVLRCFDDVLARVRLCALKTSALFSGETALLLGWLGMKAVERIDVIRELAQQNKFDRKYLGKIENIEYELGLRTHNPLV